MVAPWLLGLGLVLALLVLIPARRLQHAGFSSRVIAAYALGLWALAMVVAAAPAATRIVIPILLMAYLAPFIVAPERLGRFAGRGARGSRPDGPGAGGRPVKDVTPPDQRPDRS